MSARGLLLGTLLAGPIYMASYLIQAFTRPGFEIARHPASILSNGDLGWVQVSTFVVTGLLVLLGAVGMRRVLGSEPGSTWGPLLTGLSGVGMLLAAVFSADPMDGFPAGTPLGPPTTITTAGLLHFVAAAIGFLAWIAAGFVFAHRFAWQGDGGWAWFSGITGALVLVAFLGTASGTMPVLVFVAAVTLAWTWLSLLSARLRLGSGESYGEPGRRAADRAVAA